MIKIGSHTPFKAPNYLESSLAFAHKNKANAMMIYLGPPQNSKRVDVSKFNLETYNKNLNKIPNEEIVVHAPYIVNPASPEKKAFAIEFLCQEIKRMNYIGSKYLVLHPGSYTKFDKQTGINTLVNSLKTICQKTENVEILLENMAGKGTQIGTDFEQLKFIIEKVNNKRIGICLDTCHAWDSGYDITKVNKFVSHLKELKVLKAIKVIHVNDSKNDLNSKKDRHANLKTGFIDVKFLKQLIHHEAFKNVINILETPWVNGKDVYKDEISLLR